MALLFANAQLALLLCTLLMCMREIAVVHKGKCVETIAPAVFCVHLPSGDENVSQVCSCGKVLNASLSSLTQRDNNHSHSGLWCAFPINTSNF